MKHEQILVIGSTGKTGGRIYQRLIDGGYPVLGVSRHSETPFDWDDPATWDAAIVGSSAAYISYAPDLAIPGVYEKLFAFVDRAEALGVRRLVLLSGRGEEEAQRCEKVIQRPAFEWTVVRASWFSQNFSEGAFLDMVLDGVVALPSGDTGEPFIDVDDIADVAFAALTREGHSGQVYEVTGPRLLTFAEAVDTIAMSSGRSLQYVEIPREAFSAGLSEAGLPEELTWLYDYLFETMKLGHNAHINDGVQRALGREPRDFANYANNSAATGIWAEA